MFKRILIVCSCLVFQVGCIYNDEPMPEISYYYQHIDTIKPKLSTPASNRPVSTSTGPSIIHSWLPPSSVEKKWTAIVIHHSGTKNGNTAIFDKWHREGKHWEGVGYHFVIGNGSNSNNGKVEVTYRWKKQVTGAHCGGTPRNWANKDGIGICLVGNFNQTQPSIAQMQSLVRLVRFLQMRYRIPKNRIYGHKDTPGAGTVTECPGKNFPMEQFKSYLLP